MPTNPDKLGGAILSVEIQGAADVKRGLAALLADLQDLRPFWRDVFAPKYFGIVQDLFATGGRARGGGGRFKGGAWQPLSQKYAVWKRKHYPGKPLLVREGTLKESVRWTGKGTGVGGIFEAYPTYAIAGTSVPYAKAHNSGLGHMPLREFMPQPDPAVFAPLLKAWLQRNKIGAFGKKKVAPK